jgi:hypothetical protein
MNFNVNIVTCLVVTKELENHVSKAVLSATVSRDTKSTRAHGNAPLKGITISFLQGRPTYALGDQTERRMRAKIRSSEEAGSRSCQCC